MTMFNDLAASAGTDGASAFEGPRAPTDSDELGLVMEAWFRERQANLENEFLVGRAERLLRRILKDGGLTPSTRREIKSLLRVCQGDGKIDRSAEV